VILIILYLIYSIDFFKNKYNNDISLVDIIIFNKTICSMKIRIIMDQIDLILNLLLDKYTINSQYSKSEVEKFINTCNSFRVIAVKIRYSSIMCIFNPYPQLEGINIWCWLLTLNFFTSSCININILLALDLLNILKIEDCM